MTQLSPEIQILLEGARAQVAAQPLVKRYANTVTTAVGLAVAGIWYLTSVGVDVPEDVTKWVTAAIALLTLLGVMKTPNGTTTAQIDQLAKVAEKYVGEHRRADG